MPHHLTPAARSSLTMSSATYSTSFMRRVLASHHEDGSLRSSVPQSRLSVRSGRMILTNLT